MSVLLQYVSEHWYRFFLIVQCNLYFIHSRQLSLVFMSWTCVEDSYFVEDVSFLQWEPLTSLNCPRPPPEHQAGTSMKFPETPSDAMSKNSQMFFSYLWTEFNWNISLRESSQWLTGGFLLGVRNGAILSPRSWAGLACNFWVFLPPDCLFTSFDSSTWMAWEGKETDCSHLPLTSLWNKINDGVSGVYS